MFNVCPLAARVRKTNEAATTLTLRPRRHARRRLWLPRAELAFGDLFFNARSGSGVASTPTTVTRDSGISSARPRGARAKRGVVASLVTRSEHLQSRGVGGCVRGRRKEAAVAGSCQIYGHDIPDVLGGAPANSKRWQRCRFTV